MPRGMFSENLLMHRAWRGKLKGNQKGNWTHMSELWCDLRVLLLILLSRLPLVLVQLRYSIATERLELLGVCAKLPRLLFDLVHEFSPCLEYLAAYAIARAQSICGTWREMWTWKRTRNGIFVNISRPSEMKKNESKMHFSCAVSGGSTFCELLSRQRRDPKESRRVINHAALSGQENFHFCGTKHQKPSFPVSFVFPSLTRLPLPHGRYISNASVDHLFMFIALFSLPLILVTTNDQRRFISRRLLCNASL